MGTIAYPFGSVREEAEAETEDEYDYSDNEPFFGEEVRPPSEGALPSEPLQRMQRRRLRRDASVSLNQGIHPPPARMPSSWVYATGRPVFLDPRMFQGMRPEVFDLRQANITRQQFTVCSSTLLLEYADGKFKITFAVETKEMCPGEFHNFRLPQCDVFAIVSQEGTLTVDPTPYDSKLIVDNTALVAQYRAGTVSSVSQDPPLVDGSKPVGKRDAVRIVNDVRLVNCGPPSKEKKVKKRKGELPKEFTCSICLVEPISAAVLPCGHSKFCVECMVAHVEFHKPEDTARGRPNCPLCSVPIAEVRKLFI